MVRVLLSISFALFSFSLFSQDYNQAKNFDFISPAINELNIKNFIAGHIDVVRSNSYWPQEKYVIYLYEKGKDEDPLSGHRLELFFRSTNLEKITGIEFGPRSTETRKEQMDLYEKFLITIYPINKNKNANYIVSTWWKRVSGEYLASIKWIKGKGDKCTFPKVFEEKIEVDDVKIKFIDQVCGVPRLLLSLD
jgi:hypothetical protein